MKKSYKILAAALLLAAALTALLSVSIRQVTVSGNSRYSDQEMVDLVFQKRTDWNTLVCYLKNRFGSHPQVPFVEDYQLVFHSPFHVEIIVHEKSVVGCVSYMSSYMYFDKDGIVVESTSQPLEGIPCVEGLEFGSIVLHQPLPVESQTVFEDILNLTQVLEVYGIRADRIRYNSRGEATLFIQELEVFLGDDADTAGKVAELSDMMPQLEGKRGTLYLDSYDPVNRQTMYTFKKK